MEIAAYVVWLLLISTPPQTPPDDTPYDWPHVCDVQSTTTSPRMFRNIQVCQTRES